MDEAINNQHVAQPDASKVSVSLSRITFSSGFDLKLAAGSVVLIVGPNNAGKSEALRAIRDRISDSSRPSPVVTSIEIEKCGSEEDLMAWVESWALKTTPNPADPTYTSLGQGLNRKAIRTCWSRSPHSLAQIARWFCCVLTTEERVGASNPATSIRIGKEAPQHPIHFIQRDDALEVTLSSRFREAFGIDLVVNRNAGSEVPLHVGERPIPDANAGEDRVSLTYIQRVEALPLLQAQGDGMRSFAGILLSTSVGKESMMLIDEPEAFLHPPQARVIGKMLVKNKSESRQLLIATHSTDVVRGVLDAADGKTQVVRIRRDGDVNRVASLDNEKIREVWSDPLLRHSNILDGLFHDRVVVCEGDADSRFYSSVFEEADLPGGMRRPDVMFTHCGGKGRFRTVVRALKALDVPVSCVADFDVLANEVELRSICEALGIEWTSVESNWKVVHAAVESKRSELKVDDVRARISEALDLVKGQALPQSVAASLGSILRRASPWATAKETGSAFVPNGKPSMACKDLLASLSKGGLHVVPVGELEQFFKAVSGHGPSWVNEVLSRNVVGTADVTQAREFVLQVTGCVVPQGELTPEAAS